MGLNAQELVNMGAETDRVITGISVPSEVDHPHIVIQVRQEKTQAGIFPSHDDIR